MGWTLLFYRRVGDEPLTLSHVDQYFAANTAYSRVSPVEGDVGGEVRFEREGVGATPAHAFILADTGPSDTPPRADFPFEETTLTLEVDFDVDDPDATPDLTSILEAVRLTSSGFRLLVSDPQVDQEIPAPPDAHRLAQSYSRRRTEILETIRYFEARKKRMLTMAGALLLTALAMAALLTLAGARG